MHSSHSSSTFKSREKYIDATWHLWSNYVLNDCFGYVGLFLSIRNSDWDLRIASIKNIAALFSAYDRPCYQKLVPDHLADLQAYPPQVIDFFKAGRFTVKVKGRVGHAIALDEAHEMCINRDIKMAVVRPAQPYLKKTTHFFSYRIKAQKQFLSQLFPPTAEASPAFKLLDQSSGDRMRDENVEKMRSLINVYTPPADTNRGLLNVFTGNLATEEQVHDLLNARAIGASVYTNYITHQIMQVPSVNKPQTRRKRLLTMAPPKETKRKISHKEKEERETSKYLRRRLAWCNQTGQQYDESEEQYSLLPRALAEPDGGLHTGAKSKWTDKLKSRYNVPGTTPFHLCPGYLR